MASVADNNVNNEEREEDPLNSMIEEAVRNLQRVRNESWFLLVVWSQTIY